MRNVEQASFVPAVMSASGGFSRAAAALYNYKRIASLRSEKQSEPDMPWLSFGAGCRLLCCVLALLVCVALALGIVLLLMRYSTLWQCRKFTSREISCHVSLPSGAFVTHHVLVCIQFVLSIFFNLFLLCDQSC